MPTRDKKIWDWRGPETTKKSLCYFAGKWKGNQDNDKKILEGSKGMRRTKLGTREKIDKQDEQQGAIEKEKLATLDGSKKTWELAKARKKFSGLQRRWANERRRVEPNKNRQLTRTAAGPRRAYVNPHPSSEDIRGGPRLKTIKYAQGRKWQRGGETLGKVKILIKLRRRTKMDRLTNQLCNEIGLITLVKNKKQTEDHIETRNG